MSENEDSTNEENNELPYLIGFCRLRLRDFNIVRKDFTKNYEKTNFINVLKDCALIREMHVYGRMVPSYLSKIEK